MSRHNSEKGHTAGAEEGERFKDKVTGKVYIVRAMHQGEVLLQGEDGRGRRFTDLKNLYITCDKLEERSEEQ